MSCFRLSIRAQEAVLQAGNEAGGTSREGIYSLGQIDYSTLDGTGGILTKGVKQPFKITIISGVGDNFIDLTASVGIRNAKGTASRSKHGNP